MTCGACHVTVTSRAVTFLSTIPQIINSLVLVCFLNGLPEIYSRSKEIADQRSPPYNFEELQIALLKHAEYFKT